MQDYLAFESGPGWELLLVLTVGTAVIVGLATVAARLVRSAVWQRTLWQVATLGLLLLVVVELTGTGPALVVLYRVQNPSPTTQDAGISAAVPTRQATTAGQAVGLEQGGRLEPWPWIEGPEDSAWNADEFAEYREFFVVDEAIEPDAGLEESPRDDALFLPTPDSGAQIRGVSDAEPLLDAPAATAPRWAPASVRWLAMIWAVGAAVLAGRFVWARVLLGTFRRRQALLGDEAVCRHVGRLARRLGIRRPVRVLQTEGLAAPVAFGSLRPTIALPVSFMDDFDRRQQEAMLAHELAHLAAGDPTWQVVVNLLCVALWWHPLVWWSRRRLQSANEAVADEASLLVPDGPDVLAGCLVTLGRRLRPRPRLGWLSIEGMGFRSGLGRRVERLLNLKVRSWRAPGRGRLVFAKTAFPVALVSVAVLCTAWARPQAALAEGGTTMNVLTTSWRRSLAATVLLAFWSAGPGDVVADDAPAPETVAVMAEGDAPEVSDPPVVADEEGRHEEGEARQREGDRDRPEGEAREREGDRDRPEGEARQREGDRDRPEGEARQREGDRDRPEGEAREREGDRDRPEGEARQREGERDRPEVEARVRELMEKRGQLERRAQEIKRAFEGLRDGEDDKAQMLENQLREIRAASERLGLEIREIAGERARREGPPERERMQVRRELAARAAQIEAQLRELPEAAVGDREHLNRELAQIRERLGAMREQPRERPDADREQLRRRLEELKREIGRLSEAGRHDAAEQLKREGREILQRLEGRREAPPAEPDRPRPAGDRQRQVMHLRAAIENLRAAGLHDQAERLAREAARLLGERGEPDRPRDVDRPDRPRQPDRPRDVERPDQPDRAVAELREQVNEMRRQMEEIRGVLRELLQQREGRRGEERPREGGEDR